MAQNVVYMFITSQPSVSDATYQLLKFRHAQKAKYLSDTYTLHMLILLFFSFSFVTSYFLLDINQASYLVGKGFAKTFVIIGLDGIKCRWIVGG